MTNKPSPLERACRQICREAGVDEQRWEEVAKTDGAQFIAMQIACDDFRAALARSMPTITTAFWRVTGGRR